MAVRKSNKLAQAKVLRQILKRCSSLGKNNNNNNNDHDDDCFPPLDVPKGHFAVYVGEKRRASCRRFVVRATHLNHPIFRRVLAQAEEEFGFANAGPLRIPCEEMEFEEILKLASRSDSIRRFLHLEEIQRCAHSCVVRRNSSNNNNGEFVGDSRPLLRG
ncbi:unnamed protein product [Linum tenue]|uniref:Uncharacterized protein n=1 Tax=Linum tenue TaxID=586396 RepID=A0AAV0GX82_9ROSI|nr:unnamed protein product [Linum tenue]